MRRPMAVVLAAVLALTLGGVTPAPAAPMSATLPGFTAKFSGTFTGACGGTGPTAALLLNSKVYFAAGDDIYDLRGGKPTSREGQFSPWGLAAVDNRAFATQPGCGVEAVNGAVGDNCNIVEVQPENVRLVGEVSQFCAYALAAEPDTKRLTAAGRDGRVVSIRPSDGAETELFSLGADPGVSLAWASDGSRLFIARQSGAAAVWTRQGKALRSLASGKAYAVAIGNSVNMPGSVLVASDASAPVKAVAVDPGAAQGDVASSSSKVRLVLAVPDGIYVAQPSELWLLSGRYTPPPPPGDPPPPPPTTIRPRITPTSIVQSAAPPPPPQPPPPPPPPAPPAPPLATAAQVVAQPSAVANPAIVPGESEREAAMRLAATARRQPLPPYLLWLALAILVCGGGLGAGIASRRSDAGRYAWAETH